jgi:hypothetical protein
MQRLRAPLMLRQRRGRAVHNRIETRLESGRPPERNRDTKAVDRKCIESGRPPEINKNTKHDSGQPLEFWRERATAGMLERAIAGLLERATTGMLERATAGLDDFWRLQQNKALKSTTLRALHKSNKYTS